VILERENRHKVLFPINEISPFWSRPARRSRPPLVCRRPIARIWPRRRWPGTSSGPEGSSGPSKAVTAPPRPERAAARPRRPTATTGRHIRWGSRSTRPSVADSAPRTCGPLCEREASLACEVRQVPHLGLCEPALRSASIAADPKRRPREARSHPLWPIARSRR